MEAHTYDYGTAHIVESKTLTATKTVGTVEDREKAWRMAQKHYVKWANTGLTRVYVKYITQLGKQFKEFIGRQGRCLDVGCGNGLIGGKSYKKLGYSYLNKGAVIGVDPLTLQGPKQFWLSEYARGVCERLSFKNETFDTIVFSTTLDHIEKLDLCLTECRRVLKRNGKLCVWLTCRYKTKFGGELAHPNRFTGPQLEETLLVNGFKITDRFIAPFMGTNLQGQPVASGNTVFVKACKSD